MDSSSSDKPPEILASNDSPPAKVSRPSAWLAWFGIVVTLGFALWPHGGAGGRLDVEESSIILPEIQAKYLIGSASLSFTSKENQQVQIQMVFGQGPPRHRLIGVVLIGELVGVNQAEKSLNDLDAQIQNGVMVATEHDQEVIGLLRKTFAARRDKRDVDADLSDVERPLCHRLFPQYLGWTGRLALLPPGTSNQFDRTTLLNQAFRTVFAILGVCLLGLGAAICGIVLQLTWWTFAATGRLTSGIGPLRGNHVIYAETFAVWMALYLALSILIAQRSLQTWGLIVIVIPQIGGLAALAWPIVRGLRWSDVRDDLGLHFGPQGWTVALVGGGAYLSAIPLVGVAMVVTLAMMQVASQFAGGGDSVATPMHPIVEPIIRGSWGVRMQLLFVAVFAAVPEEIMFRGVLYRHLREAGARLGYVGRVAFATLISSFVFAVIHPQGLFGIPILMSVAVVFALVREWRGSVVPSMITHALVNAGTTTILLLIAD